MRNTGRFRLALFSSAYRVAIMCVIVSPSLVSAQNASDQSELVRTLIERVQQLEKRVAELERDKPASSVPASAAAAAVSGLPDSVTTPVPAGLPDNYRQLAEQESYPKFRMAGFSDVNYSASTQPGTKSGFSEGQFVLHINSQLSPKLSYFAELSLTAHPPDPDHMAGHGVFDAVVERTFIRYDYNDYWKVSFGRFHTPMNYWNTA